MSTATAGTARLVRRITWPRRLIVVVVLAAALAAGYVFWLRDSSLVAVKEVRIEGLSEITDPEAARAIERAGLGMTTLHVEIDELATAARDYPTIESLRASAGFPSSLTVTVTERVPVAVVGDAEQPVAADGTLLPSVEIKPGELPPIDAATDPETGALDEGGHEQAAVLGATPEPLLGVVEGSAQMEQGVIVTLDNGIELRFGDSSRAEAKWAAAARILADPGLDALDYIDLRVAERPAVGGAIGSTTLEEAPPPE